MSHPITEEQVRDIYRETIDPLYRYVSRRCGGDRQMAEDVTQETWIRAVRTWRLDGVPRIPLAWLTTVARNLLMNELRKRPQLSLEATNFEPVVAGGDTEGTAESAEVAALVNRALEQLPGSQARLLEAFHFDRRPVAEIAAEYGLSERAVEGRLRRAREKLRTILETCLPSKGGLR